MKPYISGTAILLLTLFTSGHTLTAQTITNGDGSPLASRYCREDINYLLSGQPSGGQFSGCGISQQNGAWYFNPWLATQNTTTFPLQCSIQYTTPAGAQATADVLIWKPVVVDPPLEDTSTCNGWFYLHSSMLYAGNYLYNWSPAAPLNTPSAAQTAGYLDATQTFYLTATDVLSGCTGRDSVTVQRFQAPVVTAGPDTTVNARESVQLRASGADHYQWIPDRWLSDAHIASPVSTPQAPVVYRVVGTIAGGCSDTAEVSIGIREKLLLPNAFSPNGDGINDVFRIENYGYQQVVAFQIFNRWGQRIFSTLDGTRGWDGTHQGMPVTPGTYFYDIRLVLRDQSTVRFTGDVTLIR